jgi:hypothetical protein
MGVVVVGKRVVDSAVRGVGSGFLEGGQRVMRQGGDRRAQNLPAAKRDRCREEWVDRRKKRRRGRKMMMEVRLTRKNSGRGCFFWFGIGNTKIRQLAVGVVFVPNQRGRMGYSMVMQGLGR